MKKALYLILCCIFSLLSLFVFAVFEGIPTSGEKVEGLIAGVVFFAMVFFPTILFCLLYTKERNKKVEVSKRNYKGIKTIGLLLYIGAFIKSTETLVLTISRVIDYIKYREIYIAISSTAVRSIVITFISYTLLSIILFVSYIIISRFLKKAEAIEEISAQE